MSINSSPGAVNSGKAPTGWIVGGIVGLVSIAAAATVALRPGAPTALAVGDATPVTSTAVKPVESERAQAGTDVAPPATRTPAQRPARAVADPAPAKVAAVCTHCGVVESVVAVKRKGEGTGLGAVAGGVLGAVVGHQVGGGNGKKAATVLGAVGGGVAGHEVEKRARSETVYQVRVRMDDQSLRSVEQAQAPRVGARVEVHGGSLKTVSSQG